MRSAKYLIAAFAMALVFNWSVATPAQAAESLKLAVVDVNQVLNSVDAGKAAREEVDRKMREAEATLKAMFEEYSAAEKSFKERVESHAVKQEVLELERLDLMEKQSEIQNKQKALEAKLKMTEERLVGPISQQVLEVIQEIGKEGKYSMILLRGMPGILYTRETLDITDEVIKRFNATG